MIVTISENRMGCLEVDPVSEKLLRKYQNLVVKAHKLGAPQMHTGWQKADTEKWLRDGSVIYVQVDYEINAVLEDLGVSSSERNDLESGWHVRKRVSQDTFDDIFEQYNPDVLLV